jgi:hypothetical protein
MGAVIIKGGFQVYPQFKAVDYPCKFKIEILKLIIQLVIDYLYLSYKSKK